MMTITDDIHTPAAYGAGAPEDTYPSYTKLRSGEWGLKVPGGATEGQRLIVRTKAGAERWEYIGRILWTGPDRRTGETIALCLIGGRPRPQPAVPARPAAPRPAPQPAPSVVKLAKPKIARVRCTNFALGGEEVEAKAKAEATVNADRAAVEAQLGLDEPLF